MICCVFIMFGWLLLWFGVVLMCCVSMVVVIVVSCMSCWWLRILLKKVKLVMSLNMISVLLFCVRLLLCCYWVSVKWLNIWVCVSVCWLKLLNLLGVLLVF